MQTGPATFSPFALDPVLWFDSEWGVLNSSNIPIVSGSGVGVWRDRSGASFHARQASTGSQPIYQGERQGLKWDGSNDYLDVDGSGHTIYEIFSVQSSATSTFNNYWAPLANKDSSPWRTYCFTNGGTTLWPDPIIGSGWKNGVRLDTTVTNPDLAPITGDFLLDVRVNSPVHSTRLFQLGCMENSYYGNGNIKEIVAFDRIINPSEKALLNDYFGKKYNLKINTPVPETIPNLYLWLEADSVPGANNALVSSWKDLSGNGRDFSQSTSGNEPILKRNAMNGHSVLQFNGTSSQLTRTVYSPGASNTVFTVVRPRITAAEMPSYATVYIDGSTRICSKLSTNNWGTWIGADMSAQEGLPRYQPQIISIKNNIGSTILRRDGTDRQSSSSASAGDTVNLATIGNSATYSRYFNGDIAEVIVYNRTLSEEEVRRIETYLQEKYNTGSNLPSDFSGLHLWLNAESISASNGALLSSWTNSGTGSVTVSQANSAYQPTYQSAGLSGKPAVYLNGTDYFSTNATGPGNNFTLIWAAQGSSYSSLFRFQDAAGGYVVWPWVNNQAIDSSNGGTSDGLITSFANAPTVATYYSAPNLTKGRGIKVNGNLIIEKSTGSSATVESFYIGVLDTGSLGEFSTAYVGDMIWFNRRLEPWELQMVEEYLRSKYKV